MFSKQNFNFPPISLTMLTARCLQEKSDIKGKKVVVVHPARIKKLEAKIYQKFKMAFSEYYLNLILLQNYQVLGHFEYCHSPLFSFTEFTDKTCVARIISRSVCVTT